VSNLTTAASVLHEIPSTELSGEKEPPRPVFARLLGERRLRLLLTEPSSRRTVAHARRLRIPTLVLPHRERRCTRGLFVYGFGSIQAFFEERLGRAVTRLILRLTPPTTPRPIYVLPFPGWTSPVQPRRPFHSFPSDFCHLDRSGAALPRPDAALSPIHHPNSADERTPRPQRFSFRSSAIFSTRRAAGSEIVISPRSQRATVFEVTPIASASAACVSPSFCLIVLSSRPVMTIRYV
jgi:hypothetical protein